MSVASDHKSEKELQLELKKARNIVHVGSFYRHYRDPHGCYKVLDLAIIEATQEVGVIYQKEFGSDALKSIIWIRPLSSWIEKVSNEGILCPRFERVL